MSVLAGSVSSTPQPQMTSAIESTHCVLPKVKDCDIEDDREFEVVSKEFDDITNSIIFDDEDSVGSVEIHTDEDKFLYVHQHRKRCTAKTTIMEGGEDDPNMVRPGVFRMPRTGE